MSRILHWSMKMLVVALCGGAWAVASNTPSDAMRKCKWGIYQESERCLHSSGKAVCEVNPYSEEADPKTWMKCWDLKGVRLYIKKNAKDGKFYLTYGKGGRRGRKRDPRF